VKPLSLDVRAFRGFRAPFSLPLGEGGVVLVEGSNLDAPDAFTSNGAGKSLAVVEAPMWVLFDRTVRHGERAVTSEVTHPERGADVTFNFSQGGVTYAATRSRSPKGSPKFTLTQNGQPVPLSKDSTQARREVAEILGADYSVFRSAIIVQGGGDSLATAGFASQMGILETLLRTHLLARAAERASQATLAVEKDLAAAEGALRSATDALTRATQAVRDAERVVQSQPDPGTVTAALKAAEEAASGLELFLAEAVVLQAQIDRARADRELALTTGDARVDVGLVGTVSHTQQVLNEARVALTARACPTCKRPYETAQDPVVLQQAITEADANHQAAVADHAQAVQRARAQEQGLAQVIRDLEAQMVTLRHRGGDAQRAQHQADVLRAQLAGMEQARQVAQEAADRAQRDAETAALAAEIAESAVTQARAQATTARFWATGFGRTGLQADLVAAATPVLNAAAARHAQALTAGQIVVTFDPFRATNREDLVRIAGASAPSYAGLSRGEKARVDLIIALSLRDLARWRLPEPVQLAIYDEVFDAMDPIGLRVVAAMLHADAALGSTVIVVTHNPSFAALFPSAKILRVTKRNGEADVEYAA
jgi:DNA repair exonuclease SbcCD ATPase subunit